MTSHDEILRFAGEALGLAQSTPFKLIALSGRGSDRLLYRFTWGKTGSAILIHYDPVRAENTYYGDIATFLNDINVPVPGVILHDTAKCLILMEDLGQNDLWAVRNEPWKIRRGLYRKTLAIVDSLHSFPPEQFPSARVRLMDAFGPELYKWERDYFRDNFVKGVCGIEPEPASDRRLEEELSTLAQHIHGSGRSLVHRDLQSQNVMIRDGEPYLIDFQGMRFGSPFYDLGSLISDPYVPFSQEERHELLAYYFGLSKRSLSWTDFQQLFWEASAERLMQALGAYGFLGIKKGLTAFLEHIPAGLANLQRAVSHVSSLPCLLELSERCRKRIENRR